jgi:hypothetical protein
MNDVESNLKGTIDELEFVIEEAGNEKMKLLIEIDQLKERMLAMHEKARVGQGEDSERVIKRVEEMNSATLAEI